MRRVIIESPYKGHVARNTIYARAACAHALAHGDAPLASHLLYTQPGILDDTQEDERALGIAAGLEWALAAESTIVYIDLGVSDGMKIGVRNARSRNRPVELRSINYPLTLHAGWTEPLAECVTRAASVFGTGDAARYYREQEAIVAEFEAAAERGDEALHFSSAIIGEALARMKAAHERIDEARDTIRQGARGPHKGAFRL